MLIKYGAVGYAIYFHCLELIASDVSETNLTFELEHDSEIIADNLHIVGTADKSGIEIVQEIMKYIVMLGLFTCIDNKVFCFKLLKRLDTSMTSSPRFRKFMTQAKESHDAVMIPSCQSHDTVMQDEIRIDEKRTDKKIETPTAAQAPTKAVVKVPSDPLYTRIKEAFEKGYGDFTDYAKEGAAIKRIIKLTKADSGAAEMMVKTFYRLTKSTTRFWIEQPFLPSILASGSIWDRVKLEAQKAMKSSDVSWAEQFQAEDKTKEAAI